jgi:hypothetical protein
LREADDAFRICDRTADGAGPRARLAGSGHRDDTLAKTVAIRLLSHPDSRTRRRVPLELLFQQVEAVTVDADIITLRVEEGAGTVDHWHLADAGASHIHMAKGHVSVAARIAPELIRLRA